MKRKMLFLIALAAAVSAQAITATWNLTTAGEGTATSNGGTLHKFGKDIGANGYTIKAVYSAAAFDNGIPMVAVGNQQRLPEDYGGTPLVRAWKGVTTVYAYEGGLGVWAGNGGHQTWGNLKAQEGELSVVFTVRWTSGNNAEVAVYCNGEYLTTLKDANYDRYSDSIYLSGKANVKEALMYDSFMDAAAATELSKPTPIPEPTAFALLALGVAGLALRRRAA